MGAHFQKSAAAAVIVAAAVVVRVVVAAHIAAAVAEQEDQDDDPANITTTEIIIAHKEYLQERLAAKPLIPWYSTVRKRLQQDPIKGYTDKRNPWKLGGVS